MKSTATKTKVKKPHKPRAKKAPAEIRYLYDDNGLDRIQMINNRDKNGNLNTKVLNLQLKSEDYKNRRIGTMTLSTKVIKIKRDRSKHLYRIGNAYGFNDYVLRNAKYFDTVWLQDEYQEWKVPVRFILENGKHLFFKQQGFEIQVFVTLEQLNDFKIDTKERRF
jgi:hypothetical protein